MLTSIGQLQRLTLPNYAGGVLSHYREFLPVTDRTPMITLGEGNTALVRADIISRLLETPDVEVWLKMESENKPTYSFKPRGMVVAAAKAVEEGKGLLICASTGNTSAACAAYGAAVGIPVLVVVSKDAAEEKVTLARAYGARVVRLQGSFDKALEFVGAVVEKNPAVGWMNSTNPYRLQGQKTAAFEICDVLGRAPDYHFVPVGNAGNITAHWMGYEEYHANGKISTLPKMMGYQAKGADPIVQRHPIKEPETVASAVRIGNPVNWKNAERARDESKGVIRSLDDEKILRTQYFLSAESGLSLFVEPASAISVAGLLEADRNKLLRPGTLAVCVLTGYGGNDIGAAIQNVNWRNPIRAIREMSELEGLVGELLC